MTYPNFQKEGLKLVTEASILRNEKKKVKHKIGKRNNKEQRLLNRKQKSVKLEIFTSRTKKLIKIFPDREEQRQF